MRWSRWSESKADFDRPFTLRKKLSNWHKVSCGEATMKAEAYRRCGKAHFIQGNITTARVDFEQSLTKARGQESKNLRIEAEALEWLGAIGMYVSFPIEKILDYFDQTMLINQEVSDLAGQRSIHNKSGYALVAQDEGNYQWEETHYTSSIELSRQMGSLCLGLSLCAISACSIHAQSRLALYMYE